jgi:hypothetical protein
MTILPLNPKPICEIDPLTHQPIWNIFRDLSSAFGWEMYGYNDETDIYTFKISDGLRLEARGFEYARQHSSSSVADATIYAIANGAEFLIYSSPANQFFPTSRYYMISITSYGEMILQLGSSGRDKAYSDLKGGGICVVLALLRVLNVRNRYTDEQEHYGIYVPRYAGSMDTEGRYIAMNPSPKYLITEDTASNTSNGSLQMMDSASSPKTTVLIPIFSACSECVTAIARIPLIGDANAYVMTDSTLVKINNDYYNIRGRLYLYAGSDEE